MIYLFMILTLFLCEAGAAQVTTAKDALNNLIQVTRQLQNAEGQLNALEEEMKALVLEEEKAIINVASHQHNLVQVLQSLQHWREYSPALIAFSTVSSEDLIHSLLVLQSVSPQLNKQNQSILEAINRVATIREHLKRKEKQCDLIKETYQSDLKKQAILFESKFQKNDPQDPNFASFQEKLKGRENLTPAELIAYLQTITSKEENQAEQGELILLEAVVGNRVQPCQVDISHDSTESSLTLKIESRPEAQVVSPWDGRVVHLSFVENKGHIVILKKGDFYLIMSGLGSINCKLGEYLSMGEPFGCMPSSSSAVVVETKMPHEMPPFKKQLLTIELRKGTQLLDPAPYLRPNIDDKKV